MTEEEKKENNSESGETDFNTFVPEKYRKDTIEASLGAWKNGHSELESKVGSNTIRLPAETATAEEIDAFYTAIGRPKTAAEYQLTLPEEVKISDAELESFRKDVHASGLTAKKAQDLFVSTYTRHFENEKDVATNKEVERTEAKAVAERELRAEWGAVNFETNSAAARRMIPEALQTLLNDAGLGDHPEILKTFAGIAKQFGEGTLPDLNKPKIETIADNQHKMNQMLGDPTGPFIDIEHPAHNDAVDEFERLLKGVTAAKQQQAAPG